MRLYKYNKKIIAMIFFITLGDLVLVNCGTKPEKKETASNGHTFVESIPQKKMTELLERRKLAKETDCEKYIESIACVSARNSASFDDSCDSTKVSQTQKKSLREYYRELPVVFQKAFCSLSVIQIHEELTKIATSGELRSDSSADKTYMVAIRSDLLVGPSLQPDFLGLKEQKNFLESNLRGSKSVISDPALPQLSIELTYNNQTSINSQPVMILSHEMAHIYDFQNKVTSLEASTACESADTFGRGGEKRDEKIKICPFKPSSFPAISWKNDSTFITSAENPSEVKASGDLRSLHSKNYPLLSRLCFYNCEDIIAKNEIEVVYEEVFYQSDFLTLYASTDMYEDFAESLSIWVLKKENRIKKFQIELVPNNEKNKKIYDVLKHIDDDSFKEKRNWLEAKIHLP